MSYEVPSLIDALNENGIYVIADRAFDKIAFDFSKHDKMVSGEKDKKIAELEGVLNRLTVDLKNRMGQIYELQEENKRLKEEKDRLTEMINDLLEDDTSELEEKLKNACGENQQLKITVDVLSKRIAELMEVHEF